MVHDGLSLHDWLNLSVGACCQAFWVDDLALWDIPSKHDPLIVGKNIKTLGSMT